MENLSKRNLYVIESFLEGYDINKKGELIRKNGTIKSNFRTNKNGYCSVSLRLKSKYNAQIPVHKLQAYKKYGNEMFANGIVIRHFNGDKTDNSWDNILIGTPSENMLDIPEEIRIKSATTASRKMQNDIRSYEQRCLIYEDLKNNIPYSEIMLKHDVSSKGTLSFMKNKSVEYKEYILI